LAGQLRKHLHSICARLVSLTRALPSQYVERGGQAYPAFELRAGAVVIVCAPISYADATERNSGRNRNMMRSVIRHDLPSSLVVFLVALPLSVGIAIASNAPVLAGLIAAIVGESSPGQSADHRCRSVVPRPA
jgi:hypothetical protein